MKIRLREVVIAALALVAVSACISQAVMGSSRGNNGMAGLWWSAGLILIALSFVVWLAGLKGKDAVLSVGKRTATRSRDRRPATGERLANAFSIVVGIAGILGGLSTILLLGL